MITEESPTINARPAPKVTAGPRSAALHLPSGSQRLRDRDPVGVFEVAAHGQSPGDSRDPYGTRRQLTLHVQGRSLSLERRIGGQNDLAHPLRLDPCQQRADRQIVRSHAIERREPSTQHMV